MIYFLYEKLLLNTGLSIPLRSSREFFVGSSIQFRININNKQIPHFLSSCMKRGVELKWFGDEKPLGYTSRYDSWKYFEDIKKLPKTLKILKNTLDMRIPLTFNQNDCRIIVEIISDELKNYKINSLVLRQILNNFQLLILVKVVLSGKKILLE